MLEIRHRGMRDTAATRDAYNRIYQESGIRLRDSFYLWLIELLEPEPGGLLLDISCGEGQLVTLAAAQGLQGVGVDFAYQGVALGQRATPGAGWAVGDGECLPLATGSVDYVTHIGSLEHYQAPDRGASEIARVLRPGGKACILLPNAFGLMGNIKHVWRKGDIYDDGQPLQRYGTRLAWQGLLEGNGLAVEKVFAYGEVERPRTPPDWAWYLRRPHKLLRLGVSRLIPLNLANHFVFRCRPA
jgi:SAM-dependent methyltransferase